MLKRVDIELFVVAQAYTNEEGGVEYNVEADRDYGAARDRFEEYTGGPHRTLKLKLKNVLLPVDLSDHNEPIEIDVSDSAGETVQAEIS
jgi:hypothetical protein